MKLSKALELMKKHVKCPECGNSMLGENQGSLVIEDDFFKRTCKCGFEVVEKVEDEEA